MALGVEPGAKVVASAIVAVVGIFALIEFRGTAVGFCERSDTETVGGTDMEIEPEATDDVGAAVPELAAAAELEDAACLAAR